MRPHILVLPSAVRISEARQVIERLRSVTCLTMPDLSYLRNPPDRQLYESGLRLALGERNSRTLRQRVIAEGRATASGASQKLTVEIDCFRFCPRSRLLRSGLPSR